MQTADALYSRLGTLESATNWWTASYRLTTPDILRRARRTAGAVFVGVVAYAIATVVVLVTGQAPIAAPLFLTVLAFLLCGVALRFGVSIGVVTNASIAANATILLGMLLATGGASVGFLVAAPVVPASAVLVGDRRSVWFWSVITIVTIAAVVVLTWFEFAFPIRPDLSRVAITKFFIAAVVVGALFGIARLFVDDRYRAEQTLLESEQLFKQAAHAVNLGHYVWDELEDRCIFASEGYARILGVTLDEILTQYNTRMKDLELAHPDDREQVLADYAEAEKQGSSYDIVYRIIRPDGEDRHIRKIGEPVFDHQGRLIRTIGILQDITEQKKVQLALEESEALFKQAAQIARLGHCRFDATANRYLRISEEYANIFGYTADEFLKRHWTAEDDLGLVHPEDRARVAEVYEDAVKKGGDLNFEYRIVRADSSVRTVREIEWRATDTPEGHARYDGTLQDVTELRHVQERTHELQNAQQELTKNLADARRAAHLVKLGTYEWDWTEGRMVACSEEYARMHDLSAREAVQTMTSLEADYSFIHPDDREYIVALEAEALAKGEGYSAAYRILLPSGHIRHVREVCEVELDDQGKVIRTLGSLQDVSEQVALEEQFRQAQKMEAVGQLAGGIAHDFNNLLTVIGGYSTSHLTSLKPDDPLHQDLNEIKIASDRATSLTRQLLAFSRKQILRPKVINMGEIVAGMQNMLRRLIGEHIELDVQRDPSLQMVEADPGQIEQVIMNLMINARDAMPQGGNITLSIENAAVEDRAIAASGDLPAGDYVVLSIADSGIGMGEETRSHIFEPFYSTKGAEEGTGLGLSTVFGIVKQSDGGIEVESEPNKGSTFRIYLPKVEAPESVAEEKHHVIASGEGCETIMVVEDEEKIRELLKRVLERFGYTVLTACHGGEALLMAERHSGSIDLMITDVVMPQMNGHELAERLAPLRPEMSVLYMSGYDDKMVADQGVLDPERQFLQKPFDFDDVARKIREVLDEKMSPATKDEQSVIEQNVLKEASA